MSFDVHTGMFRSACDMGCCLHDDYQQAWSAFRERFPAPTSSATATNACAASRRSERLRAADRRQLKVSLGLYQNSLLPRPRADLPYKYQAVGHRYRSCGSVGLPTSPWPGLHLREVRHDIEGGSPRRGQEHGKDEVGSHYN